MKREVPVDFEGWIEAKVHRSLESCGIRPGDVVLVHTGFRRLGIPGSRDTRESAGQTIWRAFESYLGPSGTLLVPTLSYEYVGERNPVFDEVLTQSCVGFLSETFRADLSLGRSLCPTHSVSGWGSYVDYYLDGHILDETPLGPNSPFARLTSPAGNQRAYLLFAGCSANTNTSMHGVEELAQVPYLWDGRLPMVIIDRDNRVTRKSLWTHSFRGYAQRYDRFLDFLSPAEVRKVPFFGDFLVVLPTELVWQRGLEVLKEDAFAFVERVGP